MYMYIYMYIYDISSHEFAAAEEERVALRAAAAWAEEERMAAAEAAREREETLEAHARALERVAEIRYSFVPVKQVN